MSAEPSVREGNYIEVFLDPTVIFMARRIVTCLREAGKNPKLATLKDVAFEFVSTATVSEFRDNGKGVFVPVEIQWLYSNRRGHKSPSLEHSRHLVTKLTVNEELPSDAFEFTFPENLMVTYSPPVDGRVRVEVWGVG